MKFLTDENISPIIIFELRKEKHDVLDIKEEKMRGISDRQIAKLALTEKRILITLDKTFDYSVDMNVKEKLMLLIISFGTHEETRENMKRVGTYIAQNISMLIDSGKKCYIRVENNTLSIMPNI